MFEDQEHNPDVPKSIPVCDMQYSDLIPCLDRNFIYQMKLKLNLSLMEHYERHCPPSYRRFNCLIPPPIGYKVPIKWPESRDEVWKANIPHTHLAEEKSDQNWMVVNGDKINFPGGGTHFHNGADQYIASLARMLKFPAEKLNDGGHIRSVLDVGCGVASFGAYLLQHQIIAMSLAPNDVHENQIQFALERGIPSTLGVLGTKRLPYPSRSFEMVHCSRCRIDWLERDGILLLELDRLLTPGGYFVDSSPEAYAHDEANRRIWTAMSDLLKRMCWRIASKHRQTVIWAKPLTNSCYSKRFPGTHPPLCSPDDDSDESWNVPMKACITPYSSKVHQEQGSGLVPWPQRLTSVPPRLEEIGIGSDEYLKDTVYLALFMTGAKSYIPIPTIYFMPGRFSQILKNLVVAQRICSLKNKDGPNGFVIIRDKPHVINYIRKFLSALQWDDWISEVEPRIDALTSGEERVLIASKKLWEEDTETM